MPLLTLEVPIGSLLEWRPSRRLRRAYAFGREHAHGTKILDRARKGAHHRGHW